MSIWPAGGAGEMLSLVRAFPDQLEGAAGLRGLDGILPLDPGCRRIVFCGMGGSAIAADLVQPQLQAQPTSLAVWRDYDLPHWAGENDLVIVASYSGNTEESMSALAAAGKRGCRVVGISSGGALRARAEAGDGNGFPLVELPGGLPPRAALGHGLGALLHSLARLGVIPDPTREIADICAFLRRQAPAWLRPWSTAGDDHVPAPAGENAPATIRSLAEDLLGRIPVLYTSGLEAHGPGSRWRAQINENSKSPACLAAFPELDHNDLVGWCLSEELRDRFVLIILESSDADSRNRIRVEATRELLTQEFAAIHRIEAKGDSPLARSLYLVQVGDYLSCHLAHLGGIDPMPVERIENLKTILAHGRSSSPTDHPKEQRD